MSRKHCIQRCILEKFGQLTGNRQIVDTPKISPSSTTMPFENLTILITGASSGVGATMAVYFAMEKAQLALVGRNMEKFEKVKARINEANPRTVPLIIQADVTTDAELIINETIGNYGKIDVLINNAGFTIPGTLETVTFDVYDRIMATNCRAAVELSQLALPYLIENKGNIVNVSSGCGLRASKNMLAYCLAKTALNSFTTCAALELADKGVRVNAVCPGGFESDFHLNFGFDPSQMDVLIEWANRMHPIGRMGTSEEITQAIVFLADNTKASFVTGALFPVDGGVSIANN